MSGKSGRSVTSANNMRALTFAAVGLVLAMPASAAVSGGAGAAPDLFGVREVIVDYAHFDDAKAAETCGLTREQIATTINHTLAGTNVPAVPVTDAKPPAMGVARISLLPTISTHVDDNLGCVSWVELSAESRSNAIIQPVGTLRSVTVVYWRQHVKVASSESGHAQAVADLLQKMTDQFAQQYRLDQPPEPVH